MFDSLKKKFSNLAGKLTKNVAEEAEKENNVIKNDALDDNFDDSSENNLITNDSNDLDIKNRSNDKINVKDKVSNDFKHNDNDVNEDNINTDDNLNVIKDNVGDNEDKSNKKSTFASNFQKLFKKKDKSNNENELTKDTKNTKIDNDKESNNKENLNKLDKENKLDEENKKDKENKKYNDKIVTDENIDSGDQKSKKSKSGGFLSFIREKTISEKNLEDILWELELGLLESDVAMDVASAVVESVKEDLVGKKIKRSKDVSDFTFDALKDAVFKIINVPGKNMTKMIEEKQSKGEPLVVMFVGINGTGKTTTIAKIANYYLKKGYSPVVAASDTFRAGAIEQINHHTDNLKIKLIKHQKGSDPAAVAYDAVEHAKSKGKELVLIDTAGRMQTNTNLMDEMKKIKRVSKPDLVIFVGDALTGNDAVEQAQKFNEDIDIDGVILTKADADSKGGASLSIGYVIGKPIMFLGIGQSYDDIKEYDPQWMLDQIFS
ncbi:MAG: signal recognition particle-docking protein FtsY [Methanobrevibacter sp.]|nr:signal recognition particle-docking protein FtsY [Candidatus Methanoflexus mossambicus]